MVSDDKIRSKLSISISDTALVDNILKDMYHLRNIVDLFISSKDKFIERLMYHHGRIILGYNHGDGIKFQNGEMWDGYKTVTYEEVMHRILSSKTRFLPSYKRTEFLNNVFTNVVWKLYGVSDKSIQLDFMALLHRMELFINISGKKTIIWSSQTDVEEDLYRICDNIEDVIYNIKSKHFLSTIVEF